MTQQEITNIRCLLGYKEAIKIINPPLGGREEEGKEYSLS